MNTMTLRAIMGRDIRRLLRNRGVKIPLLVAPVVVLVVLPILLVGGGEFLLRSTETPLSDPSNPLSRFGVGGAATLMSASGPGPWASFILTSFLAPLYLLIPMVVSTVLAADSFAGEHERKTMEALLHTPADDQELLLGKFLAAWVPALLLAVGGFAVYVVVANGVTWPQVGGLWFPTRAWTLLAFWVAPGLSALGLGLMVLVSSRVETLQAAHQIGTLLVVPILFLLIVQVTSGVLLEARLVALIGLFIWLAAALILRMGSATFRRERLARRL